MIALKLIEFLELDGLALIQTAIPKVAQGQVLVKVKFAGLNPIDYKICEGSSFAAKQLADKLPIGLGFEMCGEVVESCDKRYQKGDLVCGLIRLPHEPGCFAEYVLIHADEIVKLPENVAANFAAALPLAGLTALQALQLARIGKNKTVLIHAGSGGVGHLAIQLAKLMDAYVITTASEANHEWLKSLGADQCIDYKKTDFVSLVEPVDSVIDLIGGETGMRSLQVLKENGCMVTVPTITAGSIIAAAKEKHLNVVGMLAQNDEEQLRYLLDLLAKGQLKVCIEKAYPLTDYKEAFEALKAKHVKGKLIFALDN